MPPAVQHKLWGYKTVARQLPHGVLQKAVDVAHEALELVRSIVHPPLSNRVVVVFWAHYLTRVLPSDSPSFCKTHGGRVADCSITIIIAACLPMPNQSVSDRSTNLCWI